MLLIKPRGLIGATCEIARTRASLRVLVCFVPVRTHMSKYVCLLACVRARVCMNVCESVYVNVHVGLCASVYDGVYASLYIKQACLHF